MTPLAIHIADGILDWPWLLAGFVVSGLLAGVAAWRLREEEIPRVALLAAAFFVASSIHVKVGPTSVHLLLSGLLGVVLGWRAPLAILLGVTLQALLIPHGGVTTIGVNAAVEALPAVAAGALFPALLRATREKGAVARSILIGTSAVLWGGLLVFGVAALVTNPWRDLIRFNDQAGVVLSVEHFEPALAVVLSPVTLGLLAAAALIAVVVERRRENAAEFPAGAFVGAFAVIATTLLTGLVLIANGIDRWSSFATVVFLAHLPLALLEGLILGTTVGFLARVKPEMLGALRAAVVAAGVLLLTATPALAHNLLGEVKSIDRANRQVTIECYFEAGDAPKDATAEVLKADGSVIAAGPLDARGAFRFTYERPTALRVVVTAGGHRTTVRIKPEDLEEPKEREVSSEQPSRWRDLALGVTFLLALAAFVMSWRNARRG